MPPKKPKRPRTAERVRERDTRKLIRDRQKLALLEPGGSAGRPIEVTSSSVIAVRARSIRCPLCDGELRLDEETAETATLSPMWSVNERKGNDNASCVLRDGEEVVTVG